jgi:hypothetical protein
MLGGKFSAAYPLKRKVLQEHLQDNEVKASEGELVTITPQHWRISKALFGSDGESTIWPPH